MQQSGQLSEPSESKKNRFSCFLIGDGSLTIRCAEILQKEGHDLRGIITSNPDVKSWTTANGTPHIDYSNDVLTALKEQPFDYLFSIVNMRLLAADLVRLPRRGAINFHDGPLPRYAGVHATSWALMNRERTHGVSWHFMSDIIDGGQILRQQHCEISENETAYSLNMRCFAAGAQTFPALVRELAEGTVRPSEQDQRQRRYYGMHERPPAACVISWQKEASEIVAFIRALDFGPIANPFGRAKVFLNGEFFLCTEATVDAVQAEAPPGTILSVGSSVLRIATAEGVITIRQLLTLYGQPAPLIEVTDRCELRTGSVLPDWEPPLANRATKLNDELCRHETFWVKRLQAVHGISIPYLDAAAKADHSANYAMFDMPVPQTVLSFLLAERPSWSPADFLLIAFAVYLSRIAAESEFSLGITSTAVKGELAGMEGLFSTVVPLSVKVDLDLSFIGQYQGLQTQLDLVRRHKTFLYDVIARYPELRSLASQDLHTLLPVHVNLVETLDDPSLTSLAQLCMVVPSNPRQCRWIFKPTALSESKIRLMVGQFTTFLTGVTAGGEYSIKSLPLLGEEERRELFETWNATNTPIPAGGPSLHGSFERQAEETPDSLAVVCHDQKLTYRALNVRANQLARYLRKLGVGPESLVCIAVDRSIEMLVGLLGILKAGGAYVPVDPTYPKDRIAFMLQDSKPVVLITQQSLLSHLPVHQARLVCLDADWPKIAQQDSDNFDSGVQPQNLAYVIYTSGSTGKPKGVMVEHRNVVNFFSGMDQRIGEEPGVLLAVTSISFDISVLELFWSLARGFKVVLATDGDRLAAPQSPRRKIAPSRSIDFSLFYFASELGGEPRDRYRLLLEGAKFADENGFAAVWTPERHFHTFGGLYPNPSVVGAGLATLTRRIGIRAGSVVAPLHHPVRLAEEWALVDNLSGGRVGISFASGWQANDFIFAPERYSNRKQIMFDDIDMVRRLWRGETVMFRGGDGSEVPVRIYPAPIQADLPFWVTAAGNPETFRQAGEIGANVLTHLLGQKVEDVEQKIRIYRNARTSAGFGGEGQVTLMLHTYVGDSMEAVKAVVRDPMCKYLGTSLDLIKNAPFAFPTFKLPSESVADKVKRGLSTFSREDMEVLLEFAFERYFETSGLFGTVERCVDMVDRCKVAGVDEIGCLIDFGVPVGQALQGLRALNDVRVRSNQHSYSAPENDYSLISQIRAHDVTHLQCTPSLARLMVDQPGGIETLSGLKRLMLGGEALPADLLSRLRPTVRGEIHNMYGPTETTVWSTTSRLAPEDDCITIGRPIANTQVYIVDRNGQPVPVGIPGELLIGGAGVTRGYLNREDLTRERFVPNPFHTNNDGNGSRLYRTGDLVAWRPEGRIDFLGRLDDQVKIRGHRIELSEIENAVTGHDAVSSAAVVSRARTSGEAELVAFYLTRSGQNADAEEIRTMLCRYLPDYMMPAAFVRLDKLPTTPNGKVDRKALAAMPVTTETDDHSVKEGPRNLVEEALIRTFSTVLGLQSVGIHDNFFDLGGNSLSAMQVILRISDELSAEIGFRNFFETPTVAELAEFIALSGSKVSDSPSITRVPRNGELPLSFAQQRLWFLTQLDPDSPLYNNPIAIRLDGPLDLPALKLSLNTIVQRHEALRTTFYAVDGKPAQIIAPFLKLKIEMVDVPDLPEPSHTNEIRRLVFEEGRRAFDFVNGPLIRAALLRESPTRYVLLLTVHHMVSDGWSLEVIYQELGALYKNLSKGQTSPLPDLPVQYVDYALWQRRWMQGEVLESQLDYWKKKLAQPLSALQLPTDRPRRAVESFNGGNETLVLHKRLSESLKGLSQREEVTLFMLLLAAYNALLYRHSGQEDILVGTPIANRNRAELEGLIGFFANTLVIRTDLSGNPSFRELLSRVREEAFGAFAHQDLPFERLVEELQPDRDTTRNPLFQVVFAMQNVPAAPLDMGELVVSRLEGGGGSSKGHMVVDNGTSKFDLSLYAIEKPEGLSFTFEYNSDLFNSDRIRRMLQHLQVLLESILENPEERIAALPLLSAAERTQLIATCSRGVDHPTEQCLHHLFEVQVRRTPDAVAVVFEKQRATYEQLNQKANRLAHYLRSLGVGPDVLVGLFMERSVETVVAILAILKAGGAYLPMDPAYPADRLAFMLDDARTSVLLTETKLLDSLPAHSVRTICLDDAETVMRSQPVTNPASPVAPEHIAYVIYTSGSTGKPKGCIITHRNVARLIRATEQWYGFNKQDVWTLFHSFAFDFSVWEIWGALLYGGRLVVVPFLVSRSPEEFYELLAEEQVTVLNQTPSAFRQLIQAEESVGQKKLALRYVIFGGEALEMQSLRPWFERHGDQEPRLVNMYGITETTVHVTYRPLTKDDLDSGSVIGTPIPDLQVYILDAKGQPVPVGVRGEIYVGGAGLARGYLYRQELTAERFIPDHLTGRPESRLYKTGDLAQFLPGGEIEYLGRIDDQVKIRGFRIELGEIEAALYQHPAVQQAAVIIREDAPGDKRLAAYLVINPASESNGSRATTHSDYLDGWQAVFDETYQETAEARDPTFNIVGWNSSYNGTPIPAEEMRTWVDTTVERIAHLHPQHVWEIGCGTGLLLYRLVPRCDNYYATDFSPNVVRTLQQEIAQWLPASHLVLRQAAADDFTGISAESFDVVILNSIVQYFPSIDYLVRVLEGAVRAVKPGGAIFLGDLRSHPLLEAFYAAVQLEQAPASLPCVDLRQRIKKTLMQEKELAISPGFFSALRNRLPAISQVEIQLKRGYHHNELSQFRYDVVLRVGGAISFTQNPVRFDWQERGSSLTDLREYLLKEKPTAVEITRVPNARVQRELKALEILSRTDCPAIVEDLHEALQRASTRGAMEPEDFWVLGETLGYTVQVRWSNVGGSGCYDVVLLQRGISADATFNSAFDFVCEMDGTVKPWSTYANDPLQGMFVRNLVPQLRALLEKKLPEYMVPASYMLVDSFPLTANGKLDRMALPAPDSARPVNGRGYVAPRSETEEVLAGLWADILALDRVSIYDNFFELGGHSLLATQLISRIRGALGVNAPLLSLFESPTVAEYAEYAETIRWMTAKPFAIADGVNFEEGVL
jgi:natural product biosynthesis luciferase-like monooxygenase protein/amino acid adenylation domain-containing protein